MSRALDVVYNGKYSEAERSVIEYLFGKTGDFRRCLYDAIFRADIANLGKLALGFPEEVEGWRLWSRGDLAERLKADGATDLG